MQSPSPTKLYTMIEEVSIILEAVCTILAPAKCIHI